MLSDIFLKVSAVCMTLGCVLASSNANIPGEYESNTVLRRQRVHSLIVVPSNPTAKEVYAQWDFNGDNRSQSMSHLQEAAAGFRYVLKELLEGALGLVFRHAPRIAQEEDGRTVECR